MRFVNTGYGSSAQVDRIITILNPSSAPLKRKINLAEEAGKVTDVTYGRAVRSALVMDNGEIVLSAVNTETLQNRIEGIEEYPPVRDPK